MKIALRDVSPMVWRRLKMPGDISLAQLHQAIQIAYGWDDEHLHQFHIYGKDYGITYAGGLMFSDDPHTVYLDDFEFDVFDKFTYEYNFFEHWLVDIRIEKIDEASGLPLSITCMKGKGMPGAKKYDEAEATLNLIKAIAEADETTTVGDIRPLVDAVNAVKFNCRHVNKSLAQELMNA